MSPNHPLQQTLARARLLTSYLKPELGPPAGPGWASAHHDFAPGAPLLEALVAAARDRLRTAAPAVLGSAVLQGYQWPLVSTAVACYLLDRRVPDLSAANVRTHYGAEGESGGLALLGGRFAALPDDPAAGHPDVTVVPDLETLRATLRAGIEVHFGQLIERLCARLGCKPRGLWLNVADRCAGTFVWLMQERGQAPAQIEAEVSAIVRAPESPLASRQISLIELTHQGRRQLVLERATCCYWYKTSGDYCSNCPHLAPEKRRERQLAAMAELIPAPSAATEETLV